MSDPPNDNPYRSPTAQSRRWHVRYFPLEIREQRRVSAPAEPAVLERRLRQWARRCDYRLDEAQPRRWVLRRGNFWRALFAFDIRDTESSIHVELEDSAPPTLRLQLACSSPLGVALPGDPQRLSSELDLLEDHLQGLFDTSPR